jgi:hypothetical protein
MLVYIQKSQKMAIISLLCYILDNKLLCFWFQTNLLLVPARFAPLPISAITGTGTGELLDLVCSELKKFEVYSIYKNIVLTFVVDALFH